MRIKKLVVISGAILCTLHKLVAGTPPPPPGLPPVVVPIDDFIPVFLVIAILLGFYFISKKMKKKTSPIKRQACNNIHKSYLKTEHYG